MESLTTRFHKEVFLPYLELLKAQYRIHPDFKHAKQTWEEKLTPQELVNGPYLEKAHNYKLGAPLESLSLHPKTIETLHQRLGKRGLWKHQTEALDLILKGQNVIIATGTSSGKTLCYQIPILDDLLRDPSPGLRAIIIYPLNALVNDQLGEWEKMLRGHPHIKFARFTGQTPKNQIEYIGRERDRLRETLRDKGLSDQQLQQKIERQLAEILRSDPPNRLNHREAIRTSPPQVLITNFSMLEYLLERPVDAPIFENARLKYLVLDEAHAYRGVQSTEIAFLIRRVKDRLGLDRLTCIATSATLGKKDDPQSRNKVRQFATNIFNEAFVESNPIYGETTEPSLEQPSFKPSPQQYLQVAERLRGDPQANVRDIWGDQPLHKSLVELLSHDENLYHLRKMLIKAIRLDEVAKAIWPQDSQTKEGLQALLEIVAFAKKDGAHEDLLPTRLHYFVRAQDGLHTCLHKDCLDRRDGKAAYFVSRKSEPDVPEGDCPACYRAHRTSKLVEVVSCRKCGYLYGALQDLGPRRAQSPDIDPDGKNPEFDSFTTELGWAADSYWSYFSVEDDLPYPTQPKVEEDDDDDQEDLFANPFPLNWCVICGKKNEEGAGDNCTCGQPHVRTIKVFHRQRPYTGKSRDRENLYKQEKTPLTSCPNCGARNSSGLEPVRRFQESDDEIGMAMAIPLAHFQVTPKRAAGRLPRKLLCFTDNRQRAAAFPSLLEEETFSYDLGRKVTEIVREEAEPVTFVDLAHRLDEFSDRDSEVYDPDLFLPVSRLPGEDLDPRVKRNLWIAETFAYFGIPDAARESAEDFGLVAVEYRVSDEEKALFRSLLNAPHLNLSEADAALQVLLGYIRQAKAFTLPRGVEPDAPAFGRVIAPISYVLRKEGIKNTKGWLPHLNQDGTYRHNFITSYLSRLLTLPPASILSVAEGIWEFLTSHYLLHRDNRGSWKLDYERLFVLRSSGRHICTRCGIVTVYSAGQVCPRKECEGTLMNRAFDPAQENIIARWVSGAIVPRFSTLNSEEHTAQIEKDLAKKIEDAFRAAEGVNLLSSTTTFEMGINIGDLQKVLLRNAPPTSANYVQRVGRAGREEDKNAVCVTLCRRTKYDADAWSDPSRLMSGEVRTPTVFINNHIIAQRHFNATVFAQFLRAKIVDERVLGNIKQSIRLVCFLAPNSIENIPSQWLMAPQGILRGFEDWLSKQSETSIFPTKSGRSILKALDGFDGGKVSSQTTYAEIFNKISDELQALVVERKKVFDSGNRTDEIDRAIKDLLSNDVISVLAKRGFLPRYAFPLDLVTLETGWTRWSRDVDVELSRDRALAIAEFAPGAQVIAHKKVFTSAGLYVVSETDKPVRLWYFKCKDCEQIRTAPTQDELKGVCTVCQKPVNQSQDLKPFVAPVAFSVRIDKDTQGATRHRRTSLVRQRQTLTHFIDYVEPDLLRDFGLFQVALKEKGHLFRYNLGSGNKGFMLCPKCGCSAPLSSVRPGQKHKRLRAFSGNMQCENTLTWGKPAVPLAYGHVFETFCLIARPKAPIPYVESLAYSLQKGLCEVLDIEAIDIGVSWRWLAKRTEGAGVEIILYDRTPGGAGFAEEGRDNWEEVVRKAYKICSTCRCETACYDCLKDYGNQTYHEKLDRNSVAEFLGR